MIGHSWGAWLAVLFSTKYPDLISKLILVGTPPFCHEHATDIMDTRFSRMNEEQKSEFKDIINELKEKKENIHENSFKKLGVLYTQTDSYNLLEKYKSAEGNLDYNVYKSVWPEAEGFRYDGKLVEILKKVTCPVVAIHGSYDPHPIQKVRDVLLKYIDDLCFHELPKCGHYPWKEKFAYKDFYRLLVKYL